MKNKILASLDVQDVILIRHLYRVGVRMLVAVLICPCVGAFFLPVAYFHFLGQRQLVLLIENPL